MTGLAEWLLEQIAVDEAAARRCAGVYPPPWDVRDRGHSAAVRADAPHFFLVTELDQRQDEGSDCHWLGERLDHIATWDPARVLAECEAKRRLVEVTVRWMARGVFPSLLDMQLRLLALPFADRPGYLPEWAP